MKNKLMTLNDLYDFYSSRAVTVSFDAQTEHVKGILVSVNGRMVFDKDSNVEGLYPVHLYICHDEENLNHTKIERENLLNALPSLSNRPIMAYIHKVDGEYEFGDHAYHIEDDEIVFDEIPVGVIPESCNAHLEYSEEYNKNFCVADGYLYSEYNKSVDILSRYDECPVSAELYIRKFSYDANSKILVLDDFYFEGVTILGKRDNGENVKPAMVGSNITSIKYSEEGGKNQMNTDKLVELLSKFNKTLDDIDITEFENLSDEELEEKVNKTFDTSNESLMSVSFGEKNFSVSLNEEIRALNILVNDTYNDAYYFVTVFHDDNSKYVIMEDFNDKAYKQSFEINDDVYSLVGEREEVFRVFVTKDEQDKLNEMRNNYSLVCEKLKKFENEPNKIELIDSYADTLIADSDEYKSLYELDNHFDMSIEDLKGKLDNILLNAAKNPENKTKTNSKPIYSVNKKSLDSRYGDIFNN